MFVYWIHLPEHTNIKQEGFKIISSGTDDYRHGDQISPTSVGTIYEMSKKLS